MNIRRRYFMSLPIFPSITPAITRDDAINQVISSIAYEELGLSHIINAEGEKIQYVLGTIPGLDGPPATVSDVLAINDSVRATLGAVMQKELLLNTKLETALSSAVLLGPTGATGATGPAGG